MVRLRHSPATERVDGSRPRLPVGRNTPRSPPGRWWPAEEKPRGPSDYDPAATNRHLRNVASCPGAKRSQSRSMNQIEFPGGVLAWIRRLAELDRFDGSP